MDDDFASADNVVRPMDWLASYHKACHYTAVLSFSFSVNYPFATDHRCIFQRWTLSPILPIGFSCHNFPHTTSFFALPLPFFCSTVRPCFIKKT